MVKSEKLNFCAFTEKRQNHGRLTEYEKKYAPFPCLHIYHDSKNYKNSNFVSAKRTLSLIFAAYNKRKTTIYKIYIFCPRSFGANIDVYL